MQNKQVAKHFDTLANSYNNFKKKNNLYWQTLQKAIKKEIGIKNPSILDIGCGTGLMLNYLNPKKGIGIDISPKMIKNARNNLARRNNLKFTVFDIEQKPFIKGNYGLILCNDVIEHFSDKEAAIKNIALSLKENAHLIITMANPFWEPFLMILEKLSLKMPEGPHKRISEKELIKILKKYNLKIIAKKTYLPQFNLSLFNRFSLIYLYVVGKNKKN